VVGKINMMKYDTLTPGMEAITRIRYKDSGTLSNLYPEGPGVRVRFYEQAKSIAPGQSAVFYEGDDLIGGGIIQQ
jgi:tRNA-uridine 2-sulfurtransferase